MPRVLLRLGLALDQLSKLLLLQLAFVIARLTTKGSELHTATPLLFIGRYFPFQQI